MSKWFLWSGYGDLAFLAHLLQAQNHEVLLHVDDRHGKRIGEGLVPLARTPKVPGRDWIVFFDTAGQEEHAATLRRQGHAVIGGNPVDDALELDRAAGIARMTTIGVKTPETHPFTTIPQGIAFLATHAGDWFFKPSGDVPKEFTEGPLSSADMIRHVEWVAGQKVSGLDGFILQKKQQGTEVTIEGWFDGTRWVEPFNYTFEVKRFLTGDLGPRTGCQSNVVWTGTTGLAEKTLLRLTAWLRQRKYVGPIALTLMVAADGTLLGLEWTPRPGFYAIQAYLMLVKDVGKQLAAFAHGDLKTWDLHPGMALTLAVTIPPFPNQPKDNDKGADGAPLDDALLKDPTRTFLDAVRKEKGHAVAAGSSGAIACLGERGPTIAPLRQKLLDRMEALRISKKQYRTDPMVDAEDWWAALERASYGSEGKKAA